ncbi:MAG: NAD-glutamate dehydrogenase domain-containing protein, partial [Pseudomonadota bacterium]
RVNSDAIDNSAGVDCSDHEVNIKILLMQSIRHGHLQDSDRYELLASLTDDVAALVLHDHYQQTQAISLCHSWRSAYLDRHQRLIRAFEDDGKLDRALECLASDDAMTQMMKAREGLSRPELSILTAYAKNEAVRVLLESDSIDDPFLEPFLIAYFPEKLTSWFAGDVRAHPLRREIIATMVVNQLINRSDPSFFHELTMQSGADYPAIMRAALVAQTVFDLPGLWTRIEALDGKAETRLQLAQMHETRRTLERMSRWFLQHHGDLADLRAVVELYQEPLKRLKSNPALLLNRDTKADFEDRLARFEGVGVPNDLAHEIAMLKALSIGCDLIKLARESGHSPEQAARIYVELGALLGLDFLRSAANVVVTYSTWQTMAIRAFGDDLWQLQGELTARILKEGGDCKRWMAARQGWFSQCDRLLQDARNAPMLDIAMLAVIIRALDNGLNQQISCQSSH